MRKKKDVLDELIEKVEGEETTEQTIEMPAEEPPKKTKRGGRKKKVSDEDLSSFENQLVFFYSVINTVLASRLPEFSTITEEENKKLARSTLKLMQEYGIAISSKYSALFSFVATHATIYGFRVYMYSQRIKNEKRENITNPA